MSNTTVQDCLSNEEKKCLFQDVHALLGGGIVKVEIPDETWCSLLKLSVEDYVKYLQMWLIDNQWSSLNGKDLTTTDICFALTQRSFDYELQFSYAYSKQIGHQTRGEWELKKDFVTIEKGKQVYEIPAGREINEVLWVTPSDITHATFSSLGYGSFAGGYGIESGLGIGAGYQVGGNSYNTLNGAYYVAPAYDIMLRGADFSLKNRILQSDLTYKITAGANGTRLLHLYSIPNEGNTIGIRSQLYGCKVWYHYYDTEDMDAEEKNKCLEDCKDIIKFPSQVPMPKTDYCDLNDMSKTWVREFLTARAKEVLGRGRGKFMGKIPVPNAEGQMDYESLLAEAKEEKQEIKKEIQEWLDKLSSINQLERRAKESDHINTILSKNPNGLFVI